MTAAAYTIRVGGHLDDHWSARLGGLAITRHDDGTSTLAGPVADQSVLHGVLAGLRDLGVVLLDLHADLHADLLADRLSPNGSSRPGPGGGGGSPASPGRPAGAR